MYEARCAPPEACGCGFRDPICNMARDYQDAMSSKAWLEVRNWARYGATWAGGSAVLCSVPSLQVFLLILLLSWCAANRSRDGSGETVLEKGGEASAGKSGKAAGWAKQHRNVNLHKFGHNHQYYGAGTPTGCSTSLHRWLAATSR